MDSLRRASCLLFLLTHFNSVRLDGSVGWHESSDGDQQSSHSHIFSQQFCRAFWPMRRWHRTITLVSHQLLAFLAIRTCHHGESVAWPLRRICCGNAPRESHIHRVEEWYFRGDRKKWISAPSQVVAWCQAAYGHCFHLAREGLQGPGITTPVSEIGDTEALQSANGEYDVTVRMTRSLEISIRILPWNEPTPPCAMVPLLLGRPVATEYARLCFKLPSHAVWPHSYTMPKSIPCTRRG